MEKNHYPCVATIAGTDPSGGAGIQADIKTISAIGCYAASIITALVAQNTQGVQAIQEVPAEFIQQQIQVVFNDLKIDSIKIGMLYNQETIEAIITELKKIKSTPIVLDPVMVAKNGCELLLPQVASLMNEKLFPLVTLITPNLFEAEKILGEKIENFEAMEFAAKKMGENFQINVLIKGGHLQGEQSSDVLYSKENSTFTWFHAKKIKTKNTHGTGCTLSSAIAAYLAQGYILEKAIHAAKKYLTHAIQSGSTFHIGKGCGPVDHFYFMHR